MTNYTFTFAPEHEKKFKEVLSRLSEDEYVIVEDVRPVDHKDGEDISELDRQMVIEMDPEAALTFRLGMKFVKIRRLRTEEELAEEKALEEKNTVKVTIYTGGAAP